MFPVLTRSPFPRHIDLPGMAGQPLTLAQLKHSAAELRQSYDDEKIGYAEMQERAGQLAAQAFELSRQMTDQEYRSLMTDLNTIYSVPQRPMGAFATEGWWKALRDTVTSAEFLTTAVSLLAFYASQAASSARDPSTLGQPPG